MACNQIDLSFILIKHSNPYKIKEIKN